MSYELRCGNCAELMLDMPDECIDLTVTSPPYDNLRTYKGYTFDFKPIADQLFRITKQGGVVVWIVNDATIKGSETGTSFRQALYFKDIGFNLHDTMIWCKSGGGAIGSNYCYTQNFEYMFVFSKGKPKAVNLIYDLPNGSVGSKRNTGRRKANGEMKIEHREVKNQFCRRNNWWYLVHNSDIRKTGGHPAVFPEQLARDHIISWSNKGDTIFDPMCGSGTTGAMAIQTGRNFIGFDISQDYIEIAEKRIEGEIENGKTTKVCEGH